MKCDAVRIVAGKWTPRGDRCVGSWVCRGKEDLTSVTPLQACTCDARGIVAPSDVVYQVGVGGIAGHLTGVNGALGAKLSIEDGGVSLDRAEVKGVSAMGGVSGEDEVPP